MAAQPVDLEAQMRSTQILSKTIAAHPRRAAVQSALAADPAASADTAHLQEVIVTASAAPKHQNVPITIQALTGQTLESSTSRPCRITSNTCPT